jgi:hypothetical protein
MPLTVKGAKVMASMRKTYGPQKAKSVFYAMKNAGKLKGVDHGFYGHMTHESMQPQEDSVEVSGDGFSDSSVPKIPKTDSFDHQNRNLF